MEKTYGFKTWSVTTDRHVQIRVFFEKVRPKIVHQLDVWHAIKSIKKKKIEKLARWSKAIINHLEPVKVIKSYSRESD